MYCLQTVKNCSNNNFFCSNNKKCKMNNFCYPDILKKLYLPCRNNPKE